MIWAIILTKNEQRNIDACLDCLDWCEEKIVVDDYSDDKTVALARQHGAKVYQRHLAGDFAAQRNFGLQLVESLSLVHDQWVLFLDADERISLALAQEIKSRLSRSQNQGFYFKRQDWFGGKWLKHGETARVRLLRLAKKRAGKWQRKVHEVWQIEGKVSQLKTPLLHYPHQNLTEFLADINFHSTLHAEALYQEGIKPSLPRLIVNPLGKFFQNYFLYLGFLDGTAGLVLALMMSFHSFLARAKLLTQWKK